jgi:hypothetical protein
MMKEYLPSEYYTGKDGKNLSFLIRVRFSEMNTGAGIGGNYQQNFCREAWIICKERALTSSI